MDVAKVALIVALYGAGLSTILALCRLVAWYKTRRGRVTVTVDTSYFMRDSNGEAVGPWVRSKAVNDGEKPVKITGLTLVVQGQEVGLTSCSEGNRYHEAISESDDFERVILLSDLLDEIREQIDHAPPKKARVVSHSNTGRKWRRSFRLPCPG